MPRSGGQIKYHWGWLIVGMIWVGYAIIAFVLAWLGIIDTA